MDQCSQSLFVDNLWLPSIPQITWLLSSTDQVPGFPRNHLNDSVNTYRRGCLLSYLSPRSPASDSSHVQGTHLSWHFWKLGVFFLTQQKGISFESQKFSRFSFYRVSAEVGFFKKLLLTDLWPQGTLQGLLYLFSCVWSCHTLRGEECPSVTGKWLISEAGNGNLAGAEEPLTSEWLTVVSVTGQVIKVNQGVQIQ